MSSSLLDTSPGGEQSQYEAATTENVPHKKSGGQLGAPSTTESPSNTTEAEQKQMERGEQTAENIRYGQTISEGGMGGMTSNQGGKRTEEGFGRIEERGQGMRTEEARRAEGYEGDGGKGAHIGA